MPTAMRTSKELTDLISELRAEIDMFRRNKSAEYEIGVCCYSQPRQEAEFIMRRLEDGEEIEFCIPLEKETLDKLGSLIGPCVYYPAHLKRLKHYKKGSR